MTEIRKTEAPPLITALKTIKGDKKVTLVQVEGLGEVEFPGWGTPSPEALKGARLGLKVLAGILTPQQAMREANEIDFRYYQETRKGPRITREQLETPTANTLARVIGGIPPRK